MISNEELIARQTRCKLLNCHYWVKIEDLYPRQIFGSYSYYICPYCAERYPVTNKTEPLCLEDQAFIEDHYFKYKNATEEQYDGYKNSSL